MAALTLLLARSQVFTKSVGIAALTWGLVRQGAAFISLSIVTITKEYRSNDWQSEQL